LISATKLAGSSVTGSAPWGRPLSGGTHPGDGAGDAAKGDAGADAAGPHPGDGAGDALVGAGEAVGVPDADGEPEAAGVPDAEGEPDADGEPDGATEPDARTDAPADAPADAGAPDESPDAGGVAGVQPGPCDDAQPAKPTARSASAAPNNRALEGTDFRDLLKRGKPSHKCPDNVAK
jgi:hypothetical protein